MGTEAAYLLVRALHDSPAVKATLKHFYCNYNEVESSVISKKILDILVADLPALESVEFKGNKLSKKDKTEFIAKFEAGGKKITFYEEEEEADDEEEDEEEEEE
jgi:Ran GTPase-activating protein (RanGAP) involved in mRNA processing and transport